MTRLRAFGADTFRSLRIRNFRLFFIGQALSQNGTWMQLVAIDLLVYQLTDDGLAVGIATAARLSPIMLLGPWGGVISDRRDRHRLLIAMSAAGAVIATIFAAAVASGTTHVGIIYALAAASGVVTALENPARRSLVTDLVDTRDLTNAIGLNSAMMVGSKVVGPAVAGVLITTTSITWCFVANAVSYIPQLALFARMDRSRFQPSERIAKAKGQIRDGLAYVWRTPELRMPLMLVMATGAMNFNYPVVLPLFASRDLHGGGGTYTLLLSAMSVGSVIGALVIARKVDISNRYLAISALALSATSLGLAVAPTVALAAVATIPVGLATMLVNSGSNSLVQLAAAPEMRGRVLAMVAVVFVGSAPVGAPIVGWIAEHAGARVALGVGAATALTAGLGALYRLQRLATDGQARGDEPFGAASLPVTATGGR